MHSRLYRVHSVAPGRDDPLRVIAKDFCLLVHRRDSVKRDIPCHFGALEKVTFSWSD